MPLEPIETAPRDGTFIILHDEEKGAYEVARWSGSDGRWSQEQSEPIRIRPTHWTYFPETHGRALTEPNGGGTAREFAHPPQSRSASGRLARTFVAFCSNLISAAATVGLLCLSALKHVLAG